MATEAQHTEDERLTTEAAHQRIAQWSGGAENYDSYRPAAPVALPPLLTRLAETPRPALVVDLGCGTGLSTLLWAATAQQVIGMEPNDDMRAQAERRAARERPDATHMRFLAGTGERTGLPDACADIVTASQAFHWMEPTATLVEVARILRPGGVFAAYDYDWPPLITRQTDALFHQVIGRAVELAEARGVQAVASGWEKSGHLERMCASGHFSLVKEVALHNIEPCDADRFIGMAKSNIVEGLLARGVVTPDEICLDAFEQAVREAIPASVNTWFVSYRVRLGVK
jgi:SAM-dependent methyltransferase